MDKESLLHDAIQVLDIEADAIVATRDMLRTQNSLSFCEACNAILNASNRVVVSGMGKSGHIARKIAATLASTGTPSFFLHPGEAQHGDLGMLTQNDILLTLSYSGETSEILALLPRIKRLGITLIVLTGNKNSTLARAATMLLLIPAEQEACPLGLAPTASTTAMLALGDALAVALLQAKGFSAEDFAKSHPAGRLGKRLLIRVSDIMHTGKEIPLIHTKQSLKEAILVMSEKGLGMTVIANQQNQAIGIFTDGDLRRIFSKNYDLQTTKIETVMVPQFKSASADMLATEALSIMEKYKINALIVTDEKQHLQGVLNMHDLLKSGVV